MSNIKEKEEENQKDPIETGKRRMVGRHLEKYYLVSYQLCYCF